MNNTNEHIIETRRMETMFAGANKSYTTFYHLNHEKPWFKEFKKIQQESNIILYELKQSLYEEQLVIFERIVQKYNIQMPFIQIFIIDYLTIDYAYNVLKVDLDTTLEINSSDSIEYKLYLNSKLKQFIQITNINRLLIFQSAVEELHGTTAISNAIDKIIDEFMDLSTSCKESLKEFEMKQKQISEMNVIKPVSKFRKLWNLFSK